MLMRWVFGAVATVVMLLASRGYAQEWPKLTEKELFERSAYIVVGRLQDDVKDAEPGWKVATLKINQAFYSREKGGGSVASLPLRFADTTVAGQRVAYLTGQEGIWFIDQQNSQFFANHPQRLRPLSERATTMDAVGKWVEACLQEQIKVVTANHKNDPTGDEPASWQGMRRLLFLGQNQLYFPGYKDQTNPAREHLGEMYKILGLELGVIPQPKTEAQWQEVAAVIAPRVSLDQRPILANPKHEHYAILLDFQLSMLLYQRFELLRDTLAAEPVRFNSSRRDWMRLMPEEPWDKITTRMETLQALLRKQKENPAHK